MIIFLAAFGLFFVLFSFAYLANDDFEYNFQQAEMWASDELPQKEVNIQEKEIQAAVNSTTMVGLHSSFSAAESDLPSFAALEENMLSISPALGDIGTYDISIVSEDEEARFEYTFHINVTLPDIDFIELKTEIEDILGDQKSKYAIYVYDLKREESFGINEEKIFAPGSTSKLPYAIITLRDVDKGKYSLSYVRPTLERLIIHGSNTAMMELEEMLGGNATYNARVRSELGVDNIMRSPHVVQASDLGRLYIGIYHQEYLSKETNDFLLYLLLNTGAHYDNRIKQGLPVERGVTFAHKTGWVTTDGGGEAYNDSGIVYGELTDYVIVVLDKNTTPNEAVKMMKPISETIYDALN